MFEIDTLVNKAKKPIIEGLTFNRVLSKVQEVLKLEYLYTERIFPTNLSLLIQKGKLVSRKLLPTSEINLFPRQRSKIYCSNKPVFCRLLVKKLRFVVCENQWEKDPGLGRFLWSRLKERWRWTHPFYALLCFRGKTFTIRQLISFGIASHDCVNKSCLAI